MNADDNLTAFMALAAQVEVAQKRMAQQYREVQAEYERVLHEATAQYQQKVAPVSGGGSTAADDAGPAAPPEPPTFEEGADQVFTDIGTPKDST